MKSYSLKPLLGSGLFLLSALSLQAGVESVLKLDLRCYYQNKFSSTDTKVTGSVDPVRLDSKQLLKLLAQQTGLKYAGGSQLRFDTDGSVHITDSKGNTIADVSRYFSTEQERDNSAFDGKYNRETGQETSHNYFPISFTINLPSLKGTVSGIVIEKFTVTKPDKFHIQRLEGRATSNVNGQGRIEGKSAFFDGKMILTGKKAVVIND